MSKRNAMRMNIDGIDGPASIQWAVDRYGPIEPETLSAITDWLKENEDQYVWKVAYENTSGVRVEVEGDGFISESGFHPIIITNRKGSAIEKIIDNEHDAQNTLANIRNKDFPKNKQGT